MDIFDELVRLRNLGQKCALATIVEVRGSIPSVVINNRDAFANRERFPEAIAVHAGEYEEVFPRLAINETSLIGSNRKVLNVIRELEKQGIARAAFERIHAPMVLDIGAISSEAIAISVTAEMIAVRRDADPMARSRSLSSTGRSASRAFEVILPEKRIVTHYACFSLLTSARRPFPAGRMSFASRNRHFARMSLFVLRRQGKLGPHIM